MGLQGAPSPAPATVPADTGGRRFYVDSHSGNDNNSGTAAVAGAEGNGPWKTLARVMTSTLGPGDVLVLSCGSVWHETLRLPASGTVTRPVHVGAPAGGCATAPTIDGSVSLPPEVWEAQGGNLYKTELGASPLQLFSKETSWTTAHHPNRGHMATDPTSPYLPLSAPGNQVKYDGGEGSTVITLGDELKLPAGARLTVGTQLRIRTKMWLVEETAIAAVEGSQVTLTGPTDFPVMAGWGYFLLGQPWMVDSPGEWHHDAAAASIYAWMPDGPAGTGALYASVLGTAVDLSRLSYVTVDGIRIRRVGSGILAPRGIGIEIRNSVLEDIADRGVDLTGGKYFKLDSNQFVRIGTEAIFAETPADAPTPSGTITNNSVRDAGVLMGTQGIVSLPRTSRGAIFAGRGVIANGNIVVNAGYNGIKHKANSRVEGNLVVNPCAVLDDCGGIYTSRIDNNSVVRNNTILSAHSTAQGKPAGYDFHAHGVYVDESASGVLVEGNTIIDTDNGIKVHIASRNTIRGNTLLGNRKSQIALHETLQGNPNGRLFDNVVTDNLIAPLHTSAVGVWLKTIFGSTATFGSIDRNRYLDRIAPVAVVDLTSSGHREYSFSDWRQASPTQVPLGQERQGTSANMSGFAAFAKAGGNILPAAGIQGGPLGWRSWNLTPPTGQLTQESCAPGTCLRYTAGASVGRVISPAFSVEQGKWYRLSVDLATQEDNQPVTFVLQRGGGGSNGFERLTDREVVFVAGLEWRRFSMIVRANSTVRARDPETGDNGARLDIRDIAPGTSVSIANVELVPVQPNGLSLLSAALVNAGSNDASAPCPTSDSQPALCDAFFRLDDGSRVVWPLAIPSRKAVVLYANQASAQDDDRDGVANFQDDCPATPDGLGVNAAGCGIALN